MQRLKHILHRYFIQLIPLSLCVEIKNLPKVIDLTCGYFQNSRLNLDTTSLLLSFALSLSLFLLLLLLLKPYFLLISPRFRSRLGGSGIGHTHRLSGVATNRVATAPCERRGERKVHIPRTRSVSRAAVARGVR